jgi:hypothetical protein
MSSVLRALVISPSVEALEQIRAAFHAAPNVELSLHTDWLSPVQHTAPPSVLILHGDAPSDWLRKLRSRGYRQPALVLTADSENPTIAPLEDDLRPLENVTWAVMRAGWLPQCVDNLLRAG